MSVEDVEYELYVAYGIGVVFYLSLLCFLGIVGNAHVILIYWKQNKCSNFQIFILVLALNDFLACTISIPFEILHVRYKYTYQGSEMCKAFRFFYYIFNVSSGLLLALVAVERCRKICTPLRTQMTRKVVYISCVVTCSVACLLSIPTLIFYKEVPKSIPGYPGLTGTICSTKSKSFRNIHFAVLLFISTLTFLVVLVSYIIIAKKIWRHRQKVGRVSDRMSSNATEMESLRMKTNSSHGQNSSDDWTKSSSISNEGRRADSLRKGSVQNDKNMDRAVRNTVTLMVATILSYVGVIPIILRGIIRLADEDTYQDIDDFLGSTAKNIIIRGYFLNNVVNPFVYCFMDKKFRRGLVSMYKDIWSVLSCKR